MKTVVFILMAIVLILVSAVYASENLARRKILEMAQTECPQCNLKLSAVKIDPLSSEGDLNDFSFEIPSGRETIFVRAHHLGLRLALASLFDENKVFNQILIEGLHVSIVSPHTKKDPDRAADEAEFQRIEASYGGQFLESLPAVRAEAIVIKNSEFSYIEKVEPADAKLRVSEINATISPLGTRRHLSPHFTDVTLTGKFQDSGKVLIKIKADLYSVKNEDEISVTVKEQNLTDLDQFFFPDEGLRFRGHVSEVDGHVQLHQGRLNGEVATHYDNLEVTAVGGKEHSKFVAGVINFVEKMKVAKTKPEPGKPAPVGQVAYRRVPGESVIMFILNGLKEGAFKAISN